MNKIILLLCLTTALHAQELDLFEETNEDIFKKAFDIFQVYSCYDDNYNASNALIKFANDTLYERVLLEKVYVALVEYKKKEYFLILHKPFYRDNDNKWYLSIHIYYYDRNKLKSYGNK